MARRDGGETVAVIGAGNMGGAFVQGLLASGWPGRRVIAAEPRADKRAEAGAWGARTTEANGAAVRAAGLVVLAVKPQVLARTVADLAPDLGHRPVVISFAAGVPLAALRRLLPRGTPVVRAMPNLPCGVGRGATAVALPADLPAAAGRRARRLLERVGLVVTVEEEQMDAVTGLSGSGPMYVFIIIEALADAGVRVGLHRETATRLALQTVLGAAHLVEASGAHPIHLKDLVTSPGGTAIAALHSLERTGMRAVLMDAVQAAAERSAELGRLTAERMETALAEVGAADQKAKRTSNSRSKL